MQQHSLAHAILSPILVIGLFAALVAGLLCQHTLAKQLELASAQRAEGITESLAFFADASAQHEGTLRRAVEALGAERDIEWVFVALGDPGTVIASTRHAWMDASVDSLEFQPESSGQRTYFYDTTVINPAHPDSFLPARCAVRLDISQTQRQLGFQVLWLSLGLCLSIVGILWISAHVIQKRVLDPVSSLVQSIDARAAQQTTPAKLHFCDEIGKVATSLNRLYESEDRHHQELGAAFRELQLASQAKDDFMAAMSHELRTPLNAIIGFSESLNSGIYGPIDTKQTKAVTRINKAGHHLLSIVDEVMTVSNSKSQQLTLHPQRCDLREIVHFCCSLVEPQLQGKDVRLEVEVPEAPCLLEADKDKLAQVLTNLLGNAAKFTQKGQIQVSLASIEDGYSIRVKDTGIGMSQADTQRIFRPFTQADESIGRQYGGCGLGLSIAKEIIDLHGGSIRVQSEKGKGAEFTVSIPRNRTSATSSASAESTHSQA